MFQMCKERILHFKTLFLITEMVITALEPGVFLDSVCYWKAESIEVSEDYTDI